VHVKTVFPHGLFYISDEQPLQPAQFHLAMAVAYQETQGVSLIEIIDFTNFAHLAICFTF
jgi:hypothetical protein